MREKTHPSGKNKSTNTTPPPPPSPGTEISSLETEQSNTMTCWEKCCSCCRKKTNKNSTLSDTDIAALMGQYEYVVEKLHIVKVPLLLCGTEEDLKERLDKLNAINKKINAEKPLASEDWECLPFKNAFHPVYFVQEDTHPSVTEIFSRENEPNINPDEEITSVDVPAEAVEQTPTDVPHRISKETVTSHRFAMIPPEREPSPEKKETVTIHFSVSERENKNEMQEDIWEKPEYTVESMHAVTPHRSKISRESAKYDSYKEDYPQSRRAHKRTTSDVQEYYDEYRPSHHQRDFAPVHDTSRLSSQNTYTPTLPLQSEANRPSISKRHESIDEPSRRMVEQGSSFLRPIPPLSRTSTSRPPPPLSPEPRPSTSRYQSETPPPKGPVSQLKPIIFSSSSSEIVSILSSKPSVKSTPLSKDSDVLIEEGKPRTTEDTTQKKLYVDVSGKHLPKTEVHKILNKYSSIYIDNLKDPIPKDPLAFPKDEKGSQTKPTPNPPKNDQSSRSPMEAESITERSKQKMDQLPAQVIPRTEPPQSSRSSRSSAVRRRSASGGLVEQGYPAMYDMSPPRSAAAVKRTSRSTRHRDGEPRTFRDATEIRKSIVQHQGFHERMPRSSYRDEQSYSRKRRSSKDERNNIEDDVSVEMDCHDFTHEFDSDSTSSDEFHHLDRDPRKPCKHIPAQRQSIYRLSGQIDQNDPFQIRTLPTTSALPAQVPVSVHPPCCKEHTDEEHAMHLNTGETKCPHPCPHHPDERRRVCTAEREGSASDLQNTNVIKHWKIIIKQHKDTENDSSGESDQ